MQPKWNLTVWFILPLVLPFASGFRLSSLYSRTVIFDARQAKGPPPPYAFQWDSYSDQNPVHESRHWPWLQYKCGRLTKLLVMHRIHRFNGRLATDIDFYQSVCTVFLLSYLRLFGCVHNFFSLPLDCVRHISPLTSSWPHLFYSWPGGMDWLNWQALSSSHHSYPVRVGRILLFIWILKVWESLNLTYCHLIRLLLPSLPKNELLNPSLFPSFICDPDM